MAQAIVRLVNSGTKVTLTTHSDTFLQQINNLMRLHAHPKRDELMARLGYESDDLLDPNDAKVYEFVENNGMTDVNQLERTPDGFVIKSLNETLIALAKETLMLDEGNDD